MELETSLAEIVAAALVPVFGYLAVLARRHLARHTVLRAVARGAGEAYLVMLAQRRGVEGVGSAVEAGADALESLASNDNDGRIRAALMIAANTLRGLLKRTG
jgi:hypothetical protein